MKKAMTMILSATLATSVMAAPLAFAQDNAELTSKEVREDMATNFKKLQGKLGKIEQNKDGSFFTTIEEGESVYWLTIDKEAIVLNNLGKKAELREGASFTAYVNANKPMLMIYPPRYTPEVVIVETGEFGTVEIGTFDGDFVNKENTLKLHIADETEITNITNEKLTKDDVVGKESLVFYTASTRSIPAQTTPSKIIVLEDAMPEPIIQILDVLPGLIAQDSYEVNGVTMVPLRDLAEYYGYAVKSTGKGAVITKGNLSYEITRGQKAYTDNGVTKSFDEAPALLEKNKTYVQQDLIYILRNAQ